MKRITFSAIGDCIVDRYISQKKNYLGGTATNCAFIANTLGAESTIISVVGTDKPGKEFIDICQEEGIQTNYLQVLKGTTSTIDITFEDPTHPSYSKWQLGVLEKFRLNNATKKFLQSQDIVKTVLFSPMKKLFEDVTGLSLPHTIKIGDFSGVSLYTEEISSLQKYSYGYDIIVKSFEIKNRKLTSLLQDIAIRENKIVLGLLGNKGSVVFAKNNVYEYGIEEANVMDTNGAGDAYITAFGIAYKSTQNIQHAMKEATLQAANIIQNWGAFGREITE